MPSSGKLSRRLGQALCRPPSGGIGEDAEHDYTSPDSHNKTTECWVNVILLEWDIKPLPSALSKGGLDDDDMCFRSPSPEEDTTNDNPFLDCDLVRQPC
jgi:hypothetical protein